MRLMSVYFGRKDTPLVRPAQPRPVTIADLFGQWQAERVGTTRETTAEADARCTRCSELQASITAMRPRSVREAAMQLVVETDDGESDYRPAFFRRVRSLAMEG